MSRFGNEFDDELDLYNKYSRQDDEFDDEFDFEEDEDESDGNSDESNFTDKLLSLWYSFSERKFLYIGIILFVTLAFTVNALFIAKDTYTAGGIVYVSSRTQTTDGTQTMISSGEIETARTLSVTYSEVLKTRAFLTQVSDSLGGKYTWADIKNCMDISSLNETELLSISATTGDSVSAYEIAQAIIKFAPEKLTQVFKGGDVEIVDPVFKPEAPDDRKIALSVILGLAVGMLAALIVLVILRQMDKTIHDSVSVSKKYDITILGEI